MSKLLITYGLAPLSGIRVLLNAAPTGSWWQTLRYYQKLLQRQRVQVSMGAMIPDPQTPLLPRITGTQFFIAVETEAKPQKAVPLLGSPTGLQVYQQQQGSQTYQTEVVRFALGRPSPRWTRDADVTTL
ncbi:MAG: hypothetical protein OHK0012_00480 [Synechococcales cyanobacterium]